MKITLIYTIYSENHPYIHYGMATRPLGVAALPRTRGDLNAGRGGWRGAGPAVFTVFLKSPLYTHYI